MSRKLGVMGRMLRGCAVALIFSNAVGVVNSAASPAVETSRATLSDLDALRYIASHPDLINAFGPDPAKGRNHYETWGIKEGRQITFDPASYLARHPDLRAAFGQDLIAATRHYIQYGFKEGRLTTPPPPVELELSANTLVLQLGEKLVLTWSAKNANACSASGAWSGSQALEGRVSLEFATPGRRDFSLECTGDGASTKKSLSLLVTYRIFTTSYENKHLLPFDKTQVPTVRALGGKLDEDEREYTFNTERSVTFGDFFQEGRIGAFFSNVRSRNVYGVKDINDSPGKAYFFVQSEAGVWVDRTTELLSGGADRDTCVSIAQAITADFNNDRKPDVFLACSGVPPWIELPNGEHKESHPKFFEIHSSKHVLFLSTTGRQYRRVELDPRGRSESATAADLNRDGNIDIVLSSGYLGPGSSNSPVILLGAGDGTFTRGSKLLPERRQPGGINDISWEVGWITHITLLPIDGRLDVVMMGGKGAAWFKGEPQGFDDWSGRLVYWPTSSRTGQQYWPTDILHSQDGFYISANSPFKDGRENVFLRTDFQSRVMPIVPLQITSYVSNYVEELTQAKLATDGSIVSYAAGCLNPPRGMCLLRITRDSMQTLSDLDTLKYIASHGDLIEAFGTDIVKGRTHFEQWGVREGRRITFDPLLYVASHPDLILAFGAEQEENATKHYINNGYRERRTTAGFDPLQYTASNGDVLMAFGFDTMLATRNYIMFGHAEGRKTTFDALAYIASYGDLIEAFKTDVLAAIKHYIRSGFHEGRRITFNALAYIASQADLIAAFGADAVAGTRHYINWGYREGRRVTFDAIGYLANQPDLRAAFGSDTTAATQHYIRYGFGEGRITSRDGTSPTTRMEAHRFLLQTTFGPTESEINRLLTLGYSANAYERWIDEQIVKPVSLQLPATIAFVPDPRPMDFGPDRPHQARIETWFKNAIQAEDQLRQRVAWALSQIMVVSGTNALLFLPFATADFYDMLARNAFGNYRKLLEDVTLHPAMGVYLSMLGNQKAVEGTNIRPDENYAREMMQLFSIGLVQLEADGSVRLDAQGQPIPTYNQETIAGFARVFTGWRWDCPAYLVPAACNFNSANMDGWPVENFNQAKPMRLFPEQHEPGTKKLLSYPGVTLPSATIAANQGGVRDLKDALDNVFNHPNVGPFISKQLIQKLVTSNPSRAYVQRVTAKFNNDGRGTRGNLEAVVKAILLDPEARQPPSNQVTGKVKEPLLRLTQLWRAYDAKAPSGKVTMSSFCCPVAGSSPVHIFGQSPGESPSVFNFFSPFYAPPGEIAEAGLVAPELQLANENLHTQMGWFFRVQTFHRTNRQIGSQGQDNLYVNIDEEMKLADDVDALLDRVSEKLLGAKDAMSPALRREARAQVLRWKIDPNYATNLSTSRPVHHDNTRQSRISDVMYLVVTSPDFAVQR